MEFIFFIILSLIAVISALMVILQRNPIHSALSLIVTLGSIAGLFIVLKAFFLAFIQIIVYAGAVMILFIFVIMLLTLRKDEFGQEKRKFQRIFAIIFSAFFLIELFIITNYTFFGKTEKILFTPADFGTPQALGRLLFTDYLLPFEIASILLLIAMVGAIFLARREE
ncbi:MAG: NADH-quinone oxidoreductase subunit J [candidate division Zixibacteria bacterium]|nr:NADH-quinone oxidoreductase subunit J [candidate division Zixibacteria bacterium]